MIKTPISLFALCLSGTALAQSDPTLPTENKKGETIVVTASRSGDAVPVALLGASVTVIDAATIQARQTRILSDVLRDIPGIAVSRSGGVGGQTQIRLRGSEANHVLVLIDGIEASDPYQGEYDFGTLVADESAKIEVLRGQQSSLYGSDAIGGVINYISSTGAEAPGLSLRAEGGSFGTASGGARIAGVSGDVDYALSTSAYHTRGTPTARTGTRDVGADLVGASAKLSYTPSTIFKLTAVGRYSWTDADTNDTAFSGPLFGYIVDSPGNYYHNRAIYGLVRGELSLLDGRWTTALSGQIADTKRDNFDGGAYAFGDRGRRRKASLESAIRFGDGAIRHRITGAVDLERESFRNTSAGAFNGWRHTDNIGIVAEYELEAWDRASFGASIRQDENNRFADTTTYRVQGSYRFADATRVHAAYGTGVKNPGYFELYGYFDGRYIGNPNLKPEKSKGWEAGVEQGLGTRGTIGLTWFDSKLEDEIFTTYPAPTYVATPANRATLSRQHGIEAVVAVRPADWLKLDANYTWTHARENGVREIRRAKSIASFNATAVALGGKLSSTLTVRYNGAQDDQAYIRTDYVPVLVHLKDYALVNLAASYTLTPGISLFGRVENLFDTNYEDVFSYRTPGRAGYAGVKAKF